MMIEVRTGDIWGFPALAESPYPIHATKSDPHRSHPVSGQVRAERRCSLTSKSPGVYLAAETVYSASKQFARPQRICRFP